MSITILSAPKSGLWRIFCNELGLESRTIEPAKLTDEVLAQTRLLILPGVFSLPTGSLAKLRAFVDGGGRLLVTDRLPAGVGDLLAIEEIGRLTSRNWLLPVFNRYRRHGRGLDGMPELAPIVFETADAALFRLVGDGEVVATWGLDDADLGIPSIARTPTGVFMGLLWSTGATDEQLQLAEAILCDLLPEAKSTHDSRAAAREKAETECLDSLQVPPPAPGERRGFWGNGLPRFFHNGPGWEKAVALAADCGITDIYPIMTWGGASYYPSDVMEESPVSKRLGDQLAECLAACRRHGIRLHARRICHRIDPAMVPDAVRDRFTAEGRVQISANGEKAMWLCPTDPRNREMEVASCVEMAKRGVDGINLDFIRYDHGRFCCCEGCRRRFAVKHGLQPRWPDDVIPGGRYVEEWRAFRIAEITATVRAIREALRREAPKVELSACAFSYFFCGNEKIDPPDDPDFLHDHIAQDWVRWARDGLVDYVLPMNYQGDSKKFTYFVDEQLGILEGEHGKYLSGIGVRNQPVAGSRALAIRMLEQVAIVREREKTGFVFFTLDPRAEGALPLVAKALKEGQR